ncbi:hypothetical protein OTERR_14590 [Oryzomicrobium terrae]|uniref:diguanylate cyclase n=1 Tax=Oryzomicrobium terrae TaxID=1735038 RepID=A0A5C1E8G6_9RHOO|nr:PAS domain-containing protein [Oryzomicrobium terrae]QEL64935.1 hypothetical protein OTERR_14590 [Oryzomicrobium terrae]
MLPSSSLSQISTLHIHRVGDYSTLLESLGVGALLFDARDGRIVHANRPGLDILGRTASDLVWPLPPPEWTLFDERGQPVAAERNPVHQVLATGQPAEERFARLGVEGGAKRWVRIRALPVQGHGEGLGGVFVSLVDMSVDRVSSALAERILTGEIARARRYGSDFCLGLLDIDPPPASPAPTLEEEVPREVGKRLQQSLRDSDAMAPWGDASFLVLMPGVGLLEGSGGLERIRQYAMSRPVAGKPVVLSGGVTEFWPADTQETVLARADEALLIAHQAGGNRVCSR